MMKKTIRTCMLLVLALGMHACVTPQKYNYFQDLSEGRIVQMAEQTAVKIRPDDQLNIIVQTKDALLNQAFNKMLVADMDPDNMTGISHMLSYHVDSEGNVTLPYLGQVHLAGLSRIEAEKLIEGQLRKKNLLTEGTVDVNLKNSSFKAMGEFNAPGIHFIGKDYYTILDAINASGDLTIYAERDDVMVIRQEADGSRVYKVDMTSAESIYHSPVYYIQSDDIIYAKANKVKMRQSTTNGNQTFTYSFWLSLASVVTTLAVLIFK